MLLTQTVSPSETPLDPDVLSGRPHSSYNYSKLNGGGLSRFVGLNGLNKCSILTCILTD